MCGIVGYVGSKPALSILMDGLRRLEYRGYDSAGVALVDGSGVSVTKAAGRISVLAAQLTEPMSQTTGIAHTRWATHGAPTDSNAHPHTDASGKIAIVHNGIIENYRALRTFLDKKGVKFTIDTDTDGLAQLTDF